MEHVVTFIISINEIRITFFPSCYLRKMDWRWFLPWTQKIKSNQLSKVSVFLAFYYFTAIVVSIDSAYNFCHRESPEKEEFTSTEYSATRFDTNKEHTT
jgi:hypothetical protein